ncbi:thioredoxin-like protein [Chitinophaga skermanii]|uniref:Thioredoxin-like protein n=1 Tax=Chitinophaga skermanii TaxID=331697 RepID=A0A327QLR1_9BACT|nr:thioredoxin family protein [Chitinophaga skermanii]RAJ04283.1 thioredoxin-like protein [Chitinophaga skermanii]
MKKYLVLLACAILTSLTAVKAQEVIKPIDSIYTPTADAAADLKAAYKKAAAEKKHVLVQVGGNWCIWCKRLYKYVNDHQELKDAMHKNYVVYHLNYSKENKNLPILAELGFPQRFGFPALVVLDAKGKVLHIQDSGLLESGNGEWYDEKKVAGFLRNWTPAAINPVNYEK